MKKTAIFVDHENITIAAKNRGIVIDWFHFKDYLANDEEYRYPLESFCYVAIDPRKEHAKDAEIRQLWEDGWLVKSKVGAPAGEGSYKCNVDVEMAMDLIFFAHDVKPDIVVLVTGDQDFAPVALKLRERGIRVEVAAFPETISRVLLDAASGYINLGKWIEQQLEIPSSEIESCPEEEFPEDFASLSVSGHFEDEKTEELEDRDVRGSTAFQFWRDKKRGIGEVPRSDTYGENRESAPEGREFLWRDED
nr:NYN domain-containing protein [uncultured Dethiosulfovibrio sp.]